MLCPLSARRTDARGLKKNVISRRVNGKIKTAASVMRLPPFCYVLRRYLPPVSTECSLGHSARIPTDKPIAVAIIVAGNKK